MSELHVYRGDTTILDVGPVLKRDGSVQDITGYTLRFTAKDRISDTTTVISRTGTVTDGPAGIGEIEIPAADTDSYTDDRVLVWDVQIADPGGRKKTVDSGKMVVHRDVTRA